jgi:hypothetical protein
VRNLLTAVPRSKLQSTNAAVEPGPAPAPMSAAEMHESVDRARSYAILWLLMRDEILRRVDDLEKGGFLPPERGRSP